VSALLLVMIVMLLVLQLRSGLAQSEVGYRLFPENVLTDAPAIAVTKRRSNLRIPHRIVVGRWRVPVRPFVIGFALMMMAPTLAIPISCLVVGIVRIRRRRIATRCQRLRERAMPDFIDLMRLALQSGCSPHTAFVLLEPYVHESLRPEVSDLVRQLRSGIRIAEAIEQFRDQLGPSARPLCAALLASDRYGIPLTATLETLAIDARLGRQREVELAARRLPILLLFPLITCILPAFALLSIVPLLGGGLSALRW
jgi:tight adherence protein C